MGQDGGVTGRRGGYNINIGFVDQREPESFEGRDGQDKQKVKMAA